MDRDFIEKNQIVERYLLGKLPPRGASDFERVCREDPTLVEQTGLAEQVQRAIRLLDASGQPGPWPQEKPKPPWERPPVIAAAAAALLAAVIAAFVLAGQLSAARAQVAQLQRDLVERPIDPAGSRRALVVVPSRTGAPQAPMFTIGGGGAELVEIRTDLSWSDARAFRMQIVRVDQGTIAVLHNLLKDSNGHLRVALNSSALGPGDYAVTIDALDWRGQARPAAWISFAVARGRR